jgi:SAM-dependent methyltransferase
VPTDKPIKLLDVGCGQVFYVRDFENQNLYQNVSFHALDISSKVAEKNQALSSKVTTYALDITTEDIPGTFDYIVSMHSFEHFEDPLLALNKCLKVCTGKVIICVPHGDAWSDDATHIHKFTKDEPFSGYESCQVINSDLEIFFVFKGLAKQCET